MKLPSVALTTVFLTLLKNGAQAAPTGFGTRLSGANEVPPVDTAVTGEVTFLASDDASTLDFAATLDNPDGVPLFPIAVGAHIHCAEVGSNGPVVATLKLPGLDTSETVIFDGTLTDADISDVGCGATIAALLDSLKMGGAYVNVHSVPNIGGEVRGQIQSTVVFHPTLTGAEEVPAVTSSVSGTTTISVNPSVTELSFSIDLDNPAAVGVFGGPGAHLHCGARGTNGPVVAFLVTGIVDGTRDPTISVQGTLTTDDITDDTCGADIAELVASMMAGMVYVNVHSVENEAGEVRGQIAEEPGFMADLLGSNEVPAVTTNVVGTAALYYSTESTSMPFLLDMSNPNGVPLLGVAGAHIHCGLPEDTGPVVASLAPVVAGGITDTVYRLNGILYDSDIVNDSCGATLQALSDTMVVGGAYVNVHSSDNPTGEVRANLGTVPTQAPSAVPTQAPSAVPSQTPTDTPTSAPTASPTVDPIPTCNLLTGFLQILYFLIQLLFGLDPICEF